MKERAESVAVLKEFPDSPLEGELMDRSQKEPVLFGLGDESLGCRTVDGQRLLHENVPASLQSLLDERLVAPGWSADVDYARPRLGGEGVQVGQGRGAPHSIRQGPGAREVAIDHGGYPTADPAYLMSVPPAHEACSDDDGVDDVRARGGHGFQEPGAAPMARDARLRTSSESNARRRPVADEW